MNDDENSDFEKRFAGCKAISDSIERAKCLYPLLYDLTKLQDKIQLGIPSINESTAIAKSMTNNANAIMLNVSELKGDIRPILRHGYFEEKMNHLINDWNAAAQDYNITHEEKMPFYTITKYQKKYTPEVKFQEQQHELIFEHEKELWG